eukprot:352366-Chlamydomonas_euryale.AAC.1
MAASWQPAHGSAQGCTLRAYSGSPSYCTYEHAARRVQYVLYAQVKRCGCRRWCCWFRNSESVCHGVRTVSCRSFRAWT